TFRRLTIRDPKFPSPAGPDELIERVVGRRITAVDRRGKYLLLALSSGEDLVIHLRMTGELRWRPGAPDEGERFVRAVFTLDDGASVTFADMRRFGRGWVAPGGSQGRRHWDDLLGVEPLSPRFSASLLEGLLAGRRGPLKGALLNQRLIAGLGNIYADEVLFAAGLHPERVAGSLSRAETVALHAAIVDRVRLAVDSGGSSIDTYRDALGDSGSMQDHLRVHLRAGRPCVRCSDTVVKTRVVQRGSYWCPTCQRR
ncbi:MAG TPA: bifunctional DNA-formamidopyrimidine glycosylase/DNA-(apurinic or apyrimidinic site) lyase, partial [Miltoncostaeaceae bacterium]|nr:bifunctional DNA-formamidopyrimidine glycosylase/DNA-(apurinic or apyrimidinic site) lyase [Miltoncostaeaceae bacterium]